jgi:hypothetical protein
MTRLDPEQLPLLRPVIGAVFEALRDGVLRLHARAGGAQPCAIFSSEPPGLTLHTPLATGADQFAADGARDAGYCVRALLPFAAADYLHDFAHGCEQADFERQLARADSQFALPCERNAGDVAYVTVGRAVVAAADVLVAVWDGREESGPGGTAHVVDLALRDGVPVIHILVNRDDGRIGPVALLTGGDAFEPQAAPLKVAADYDALLAGVLLPENADERDLFALYLGERERTRNWRIEYPLLLALLGVRRLGRPWRERIALHGSDVAAPSPFDRAYGWSNMLAVRYAQKFRSGHVTNYVLSALAVLLALFGLVAPAAKPFLVVGELATIALLYLNTHAGTRGDWHRRWLQYRFLAESLRPLPYLKRTGMAPPPFRQPQAAQHIHRITAADWTRWYANALWRQMECPSGTLTTAGVRTLAAEVLDEQVLPQAHYHRGNAHQMRELDHRLHRIGNLLMLLVIATCIAFLGAFTLFREWTHANVGWFVLLTAGAPAVGAAVFGMRGHAEHLLAASRSASTMSALQANAVRLERVEDLDTLVEELERTAANMLDDLNQWTLAYRERSLAIPA